jgi:hypothetical protein
MFEMGFWGFGEQSGNWLLCQCTGSVTYCWANGLDAIIDAAREFKKRKIHHVKFLLIGDGSENVYRKFQPMKI